MKRSRGLGASAELSVHSVAKTSNQSTNILEKYCEEWAANSVVTASHIHIHIHTDKYMAIKRTMLYNMYPVHAVIVITISLTLTSFSSHAKLSSVVQSWNTVIYTIHYHITLSLHCHSHSVQFHCQVHCPLIIMVMAATMYTISLPRGNTVNQMARQPQSLFWPEGRFTENLGCWLWFRDQTTSLSLDCNFSI